MECQYQKNHISDFWYWHLKKKKYIYRKAAFKWQLHKCAKLSVEIWEDQNKVITQQSPPMCVYREAVSPPSGPWALLRPISSSFLLGPAARRKRAALVQTRLTTEKREDTEATVHYINLALLQWSYSIWHLYSMKATNKISQISLFTFSQIWNRILQKYIS